MARRIVRGGLAAILPLLALPWIGCEQLPASDLGGALAVTQVPAPDGVRRFPDRLSPDARYPAGSRVLLVRPEGGPGNGRVLSPGLWAAGAPAVSPGADSILLAGKRTQGSPWAIFEVDLRRSRPRAVIEMDRDCTDPSYLPGDRLVFTCIADRKDAAGNWDLYVASLDGSQRRRITFGPGSAFDPTPLRDGRILFSLWQGAGAGRSPAGGVGLFTVNPDGSLLDGFTGSHRPPPLKFRARQTGDGGVVFLATEGPPGVPRLQRVEMGRPLAAPRTLPLDRSEGTVIPGAVEPLPDGGYLVAGRPMAGPGRPTWGIFRWRSGGPALERLFDSPGWDEVEAVPLLPVAGPRGRPSALDPERDTGTLVCYDARRSDHQVGPPASAAPPARVAVEGSSRTLLGTAAVEEDGSFLLEVPADRPIRLRTLDAAGREIATSSWFWVRPGEVRACFGCHESRESAPVNRVVMALSGDPQRLPEETRVADR